MGVWIQFLHGNIFISGGLCSNLNNPIDSLPNVQNFSHRQNELTQFQSFAGRQDTLCLELATPTELHLNNVKSSRG